MTGIARKAARGGLVLFVGNTASTFILAVGVIIVARLLGPSNYGLYTLAVVVPTLLVALSDMGMNLALVRLPAKLSAEGDHARAHKLIRLGFMLKVTISAVAFFICYMGSNLIATSILNRPGLAPYLQIASFLIIFQAVVDATNHSFIGLELMNYSAATQVMQAVSKSTLQCVLVLVGLGVGGALTGFVLAFAATGLTSATILHAKHTGSSRHSTDSLATGLHSLLSYGLPLYLAALLGVFLAQYQSIVLAYFASNIEIGNFSATWNFTTFMLILSYPITTAMFPMFSKMDPETQRSDLARGFTLAVKYASLLMIPASVAVMIFSRDLIYLTYGSNYTFAPQYLMLLSSLYLLTAVSYIVIGTFLNGVADTKTVVKMSALTLAIYLPLGPALASLWGPYGLIIAYIVANAFSNLYGIRRAKMKLDAQPDLKAAGRILLAAFAAAIPTVGLIQLVSVGVGALNLLTGGLAYLLAYLTLAPMLGAVNRQDVLNLRTLLCSTRLVGVLVNPLLNYEMWLLVTTRRD